MKIVMVVLMVFLCSYTDAKEVENNPSGGETNIGFHKEDVSGNKDIFNKKDTNISKKDRNISKDDNSSLSDAILDFFRSMDK